VIKEGSEAPEILLSCGIGSKLGKVLHVGLVANQDATCSDLFHNPNNYEGVLDPKFHSNEMEVSVDYKHYEHSFFKPIDLNYKDNFYTNFETCLATMDKSVGPETYSPFEMNYNCYCKG
jgi:hypothetical protein